MATTSLQYVTSDGGSSSFVRYAIGSPSPSHKAAVPSKGRASFSCGRRSFLVLLSVQTLAFIVAVGIFAPRSFFVRRGGLVIFESSRSSSSSQRWTRSMQRINRTCSSISSAPAMSLKTTTTSTVAVNATTEFMKEFVEEEVCIRKFLIEYLEYCERSLRPRRSNVADFDDHIRPDGNVSCLCPCIPDSLGTCCHHDKVCCSIEMNEANLYCRDL